MSLSTPDSSVSLFRLACSNTFLLFHSSSAEVCSIQWDSFVKICLYLRLDFHLRVCARYEID